MSEEGDSLSRLFSRQNLSPQFVRALIQSEKGDHRVSRLKVGQTVEFRYAADSTLAELAVIQSPFHQTVAIYRDNTWAIEQRHREPEIYIEQAQATISSSLFLAGARAGLPDNLIMELANIYGHVIDFVYEIRKGDQFVVTFEKRYLDGEFIEYGNILAAEFINAKVLHRCSLQRREGRHRLLRSKWCQSKEGFFTSAPQFPPNQFKL